MVRIKHQLHEHAYAEQGQDKHSTAAYRWVGVLLIVVSAIGFGTLPILVINFRDEF